MISIKVIKRDGRAVEYDKTKIEIAITKANNDVPPDKRASKKQIDLIIKYIESLNKKRMLVEDIQDIIETKLMSYKKYELAKTYIIYRYTRALVRKSNTTDETILSIIRNGTKEINYEKEKKEVPSLKYQRDLISSYVSDDLTKRILLTEEISSCHEEGRIFFHDTDYFIEPLIGSTILNIEETLEKETIISDTNIKKSSDFITIMNILSLILIESSFSTYGSETIDIRDLSKYLKIEEENITKSLKENYQGKIKEQYLNTLIEETLKNKLFIGIQNFLYQISTLENITGKKSKICLYLNTKIEEELSLYNEKLIKELLRIIIDENQKQRIKIIYAINDENKDSTTKYYYLTKLALKAHMNNNDIDFVSEKNLKELANSISPPIYKNKFLPIYKDQAKYITKGRFNQGEVSINLVTIALESNKNEEEFYKNLELTLDICKESLLTKHYLLLGQASDISKIHYQDGTIAKLSPKEKIDKLLKNGYSTLLLNYVGLNEVVKIFDYKTLLDEDAKKFALKIVKFIEKFCDEATKETGIKIDLYAKNDEKTNKYFLEKDKEKYGLIKNITDKDHYTSAYFLEEDDITNIKEQVEYEKEFMKLSKGGTTTILNIPTLDNIDEKEEERLIKFIVENTIYTELKYKNN